MFDQQMISHFCLCSNSLLDLEYHNEINRTSFLYKHNIYSFIHLFNIYSFSILLKFRKSEDKYNYINVFRSAILQKICIWMKQCSMMAYWVSVSGSTIYNQTWRQITSPAVQWSHIHRHCGWSHQFHLRHFTTQ